MTEESIAIRIQELPLSWFDRRQYRPRVRGVSGDSWFLLSAAFSPLRSVPTEAPVEPLGGRAALQAVFEATHRRWGLPLDSDARRSLHFIGQEGTAAVVTGQQPGFLGGPLMTLYKALTTVAAARAYRALTGRPCVPVFWVAAEDHDLDEAREARFPGSGGRTATFRYPGEADRRPLSEYPMHAEALAVLDSASEYLARRRHGELAKSLLDLYRERDFSGGFAAILASLLPKTGLLFLDPATVRPQAVSLLRAVVEHPAEVLACVEKGRRDVREHGIEPIVSGRFPLFALLDGKRQHLSIEPLGLQVDGTGERLPRDKLLRLLAEEPPALSPGALLRPLIQQAVLPCVLAVGGPAEVGYFAQLGPLADFLGVRRPSIALRFNATLIDGKPARLAATIPLERLARAESPEDLLEPAAEPAGLTALRAMAASAQEVIARALGEIGARPEAGKLKARAARILSSLDHFASQLEKAHLRLRTAELEQARRLFDAMFPEGELQERRWGYLYFVAKHGTRWIEELLESLAHDPLPLAHRLVLFEGPEEDAAAEPG